MVDKNELKSKGTLDKICLIGRSRDYNIECREGKLPEGLEKYKYSIAWPIPLNTPNLHLSCYFDEKNYAAPDFPYEHEGIDIQAESGTIVMAPEKSKVIFCENRDRLGLANIYLYGEDTHIVYSLYHLDRESIPDKIRKIACFNPNSEVIVDIEPIGSIGKWPNELNHKNVPEDIKKVYKMSYNHLHFSTYYYPDQSKLIQLLKLDNEFNPLLILKNLEESLK